MSRLKVLIKQTFRKLGFELCSTDHYNYLAALQEPRKNHFFRAWRRHFPNPKFIVDVGANHGNWTRSALRYFPETRFLLVEPQERLKPSSIDLLARPTVEWLQVGVSNCPGVLKLALTPNDASASFTVSDEEAKAAGYPQIEVPVVTLNQIVSDAGLIPEIVKIDAEGLDLEVLSGASELLGKTDVFFIECSICSPDYPNTLEAVCRLMWEKGYRVMEITDLNDSPRHDVLWLTELVFVKVTSPIWSTFDRQI